MNPYITASDRSHTLSPNYNYLAPLWCSNGVGTPSTLPLNLLWDYNIGTVVTENKPHYWDSPISGDNMELALTNGVTWEWRPVGGGVKLRYSGNVMQRAGKIYLYEEPENSVALTQTGAGVDPADLLKQVECSYSALGDGEYAVLWHPRTISDLDYSSAWQSAATDLAKYQTLLIVIQGCASQTFEFEAIMHWEMIGSQIPSRTKTDSDPSGLAAVQGAMGPSPSLNTPYVTAAFKQREVINKLAHESSAGGIYTSRGMIY